MFKRALAACATIALLGAGCSGAATVDTQADVNTNTKGTPSTGNPTTTNSAPQDSATNGGETKMGAQAASEIHGSWKMGAWKKPAAGEKLQDVSKSNFTLTLGSDGKLTAKICNNMSGNYSFENGKLTGPQIVSTLMFCEGVPSQVEAAFAADLTAGMTANADDESLVMTGLVSQNTYMFAPVK